MYDSREKAIRDRQWALNESRKAGLTEGKLEGRIEGLIEGEAKTIQVLQEILQLPISSTAELRARSLGELQAVTTDLREKIRHRS